MDLNKPYKSKLNDIKPLDNYYSIGIFSNGEEALVHNSQQIGYDFLIFPKNTFLSSEFLQTTSFFQNAINEDSFTLEEYEYKDHIFKYYALPVTEFLQITNFSSENINSLEYNKPFTHLEAVLYNNNVSYFTNFPISPDYSKDSIDYEFIPDNSMEETKSTILEKNIDQIQDGNKASDSLLNLSENQDLIEDYTEEDNKSNSTESISSKIFDPIDQYFLTQNQIEKLLEIRRYSDFKEKNIQARDWLVSIFSNRTESKETGKGVNILPALIPIEGYFKLPANTLENQPEEVLTTAGLYIFNMFAITAAFHHKIPYINTQMKSGDMEKLHDDLSRLLIENKIQVKDELEIYWNNITFLSYLTELFMPGMPIKYLETPDSVLKKKSELLKQYKDIIESGDAAKYADLVEKPLIKELENEFKKDPISWNIYELGKKPTMSNNVKVNLLSVGPVKNAETGGYDIITNSYDEGIDIEKYNIYCNQLIAGTYDRSMKTGVGGAMTKQIFAAFSDLILDEPGSDCGTTRTYKFVLSKNEKNDYLYCYILNPRNKKELIELTPDIIDDFIGKEIELRSPLYCASEKYCNKCIGNLYYRLGIKNIGLVENRLSSSIMAKSMVSFHNSSITTVQIELQKYFS